MAQGSYTRYDCITTMAPTPVADFTTTSGCDVSNGLGAWDVTLTVTDVNGATASCTKKVIGQGWQHTHFEDKSTGYIKLWEWEFGDSVRSKLSCPTHLYKGPTLPTGNTYYHFGRENCQAVVLPPTANELVFLQAYDTPTIYTGMTAQFWGTDGQGWYHGPGTPPDDDWIEGPLGGPDSQLFLFESDGTLLMYSDYYQRFYESYDGGMTWVQVTTTPPVELYLEDPVYHTWSWHTLTNFRLVHLKDDAFLLIGGWCGVDFNFNHVYRSDDRCRTWTKIVETAEWGVRHSLTAYCSPTTEQSPNQVVYIAGGWVDIYGFYKDIWKSEDDGMTWTLVVGPPTMFLTWTDYEGIFTYIGEFVQLQDVNNTLLYVTYNAASVYQSLDGGASWVALNTLPAGQTRTGYALIYIPWTTLAAPLGRILIMGGMGAGGALGDTWESLDLGATWTKTYDYFA